MKNYKYILGLLIFSLFAISSCDEDVPQYIAYDNYSWSYSDVNGGNWKPILLTSNEQIPIADPTDVNSAEYKAELATLKSAAAGATASQKTSIEYWSNNPIIRWNEISRRLSAKYNLAPAPNADGSYPAPNATTPDKYPLFPFAHPPYSCRAFAYLAVAQFDAMVATWHYKYKFNRPEPVTSDASIPQSFPKSNLPSYPSYSAVLAAVSRDILTAMFPLEKDYLAAKAEEAINVALWSGANVQSDIDAGKVLGAEIAKVVMARAKTDGMSAAQTPKPISDSLKKLAFNTFGWSWTNQETPPRPVGITPYFGKVKAWTIANIADVRPPAPPKPGSAEFNKAADELKNVLDNITDEQRKIANFWSDGLGTYTPPGHWNRFACDALIKYKINPMRSARTLAYLNMAEMDAGIACWDAKYYYHYPRPVEAIPGFKTILGTPNFPSYTSGHSTYSAAAADVLGHFFPNESALFNTYAKEAAESRSYGGIHYRFDIEAGLETGKKVAGYVLNVAKADGAE
jgi:hypothetical protein